MSNLTAEQIVVALRDPAVPLSPDQIKACYQALNVRHGNVMAVQALAFRPGDEVEFDARGQMRRGTVTKVNQKTVSVQVGATPWRVGAAYLRRVEHVALAS